MEKNVFKIQNVELFRKPTLIGKVYYKLISKKLKTVKWK